MSFLNWARYPCRILVLIVGLGACGLVAAKVKDDYDPSDSSGFRQDLLQRYLIRARELAQIKSDWRAIESILEKEDSRGSSPTVGKGAGDSPNVPWRRKVSYTPDAK